MGSVTHNKPHGPARETSFINEGLRIPKWSRRRNGTVVVRRNLGGSGDILASRSVLRAVKRMAPNHSLHYALPLQFSPLVADLDDIDWILPSDLMTDDSQYDWSGDISSACLHHEMTFRHKVHLPRADIWALHLGANMNGDYSARISFEAAELDRADEILRKAGATYHSKVMFVCPVSADRTRNLPEHHVEAARVFAAKHNMLPFFVHTVPVKGPFQTLSGLQMREWMALFTRACVVLTTDTSHVHLAGLLGVPTAAMFNHTSGKVVPAHYGSVVPYQLHRDDPGGLACCPCYDWGGCSHTKTPGNDQALKCAADIPQATVLDALERAVSAPVNAQWTVRTSPVNWRRVIVTPPHKNNTTPSRTIVHNPVGYHLHLGTSHPITPAAICVAGMVASHIRQTQRNSRVFMVPGTRIPELCKGLFDAMRHIEKSVPTTDPLVAMDQWMDINLSAVGESMRGPAQTSMVDAVYQKTGLRLTNMSPVVNFPQDMVERWRSRPAYALTEDDNSPFVSPSLCLLQLDDNDWLEILCAIYHAGLVVTANVQRAVMAACMGTKFVYTGPANAAVTNWSRGVVES